MTREQNNCVFFDVSRNIDTKDLTQAGLKLVLFLNNTIRCNENLIFKTNDNQKMAITRKTVYKIANRDNVKDKNKKYIQLSDELYQVKLRAGMHIDKLLLLSKGNNKIFKDTKKHKFAKDGFMYRKVFFMDITKKLYSITISIGRNNNINTVYNLGNIKEVEYHKRHKGQDS